VLTKCAGIQTDSALYSWFSTSFDVSSSWKGEQTVLNFGAVDYEATVFVNGKKAGFHRGGYFRFSLDVTEHLKFGQKNEL
jgi:beta-galactosidase/beta-glucuronidase